MTYYYGSLLKTHSIEVERDVLTNTAVEISQVAYDHDHDCWKFPVDLFGNKRSTTAKWKRIVAHVLEERDWIPPLVNVPRASVLDNTADILSLESCRMYSASEQLWRMYCPHEALIPVKEMEYIQLSLSGLRELWFTVGFLERTSV